MIVESPFLVEIILESPREIRLPRLGKTSFCVVVHIDVCVCWVVLGMGGGWHGAGAHQRFHQGSKKPHMGEWMATKGERSSLKLNPQSQD